jgi:bifunctional non-homologous end joining protein LigD
LPATCPQLRAGSLARDRFFGVLRLPDPMLSRPGPLPTDSAWSYELKWDGFRAVVSTENGLAVRSRRGWDMTPVLPELGSLPIGLVLDGELVAWNGTEPYFPLVCRRVLNRDMAVPLTFVIFDVLRRDGVDLTNHPYIERRRSSRASSSTARRGRPASASTTGERCLPASASSASRALSRRGTPACIGRTSAAG